MHRIASVIALATGLLFATGVGAFEVSTPLQSAGLSATISAADPSFVVEARCQLPICSTISPTVVNTTTEHNLPVSPLGGNNEVFLFSVDATDVCTSPAEADLVEIRLGSAASMLKSIRCE